jgi:hypothetical protein
MSEAKTIPAKYIFLDIVGFTNNRSAEAQSHIVEVLNHIVEKSIVEHGLPKAKVLFVPASDGLEIALLNVESPYDIHLQIALSIIEEVNKYNSATPDEMRRFEVRVGINSNTDNLITDINGHQNIVGAGVNLGLRVMHLADGNQILVSSPVFGTLRYHEKYISSFRGFRVKIKHGLEMPVYQFKAEGFEGLNTSVPSSLEDAEKIELQPRERTVHGKPTRRDSVEDTQPSFNRNLAETQFPQSAAATENQTQSYLKGILPEPETSETATGRWIKSKTVRTEPLPFLEEVESPSQNRSLVWAAVICLLVGTSLGTWFWMRGSEPAPNTTKAPVSTISVVPSESPASTTTVVPSETPNQTVTEVVQTTKPGTALASKPAALTETKVKDTTTETLPARPKVQRTAVHRPVIRREAARRVQPQPKKQTVRAVKSKSPLKFTIEDLIDEN